MGGELKKTLFHSGLVERLSLSRHYCCGNIADTRLLLLLMSGPKEGKSASLHGWCAVYTKGVSYLS